MFEPFAQPLRSGPVRPPLGTDLLTQARQHIELRISFKTLPDTPWRGWAIFQRLVLLPPGRPSKKNSADYGKFLDKGIGKNLLKLRGHWECREEAIFHPSNWRTRHAVRNRKRGQVFASRPSRSGSEPFAQSQGFAGGCAKAPASLPWLKATGFFLRGQSFWGKSALRWPPETV